METLTAAHGLNMRPASVVLAPVSLFLRSRAAYSEEVEIFRDFWRDV